MFKPTPTRPGPGTLTTLTTLGLLVCLGATAATAPAPATSPLSPAPVPSGAGTPVDVQALLGCRAVSDALQRLVCYDRVLAPVAAAGPLAATASAAPAAPAVPAVPAVPAAKIASPAPLAAPPQPAVAQFGLPRTDAAQLPSLVSELPGPFTGWTRGHRFTLANGQVWQVIDNSVGAYRLDSPKVTVQRGVLGSYFLEIEGVQQTPKVRRVR